MFFILYFLLLLYGCSGHINSIQNYNLYNKLKPSSDYFNSGSNFNSEYFNSKIYYQILFDRKNWPGFISTLH